MKRSNKHTVAKLNFYPLSGGINVAQVAEQIGETEMQECQNFIYDRDSTRLVGRGGLKALTTFASNIISMYYDIENNSTFVFLEDRDCYQLVLSSGKVSSTYIGKVSGYSVPHCEKFKGALYVASGSSLQYYNYESGTKLVSMTYAPICDLLFYRFSRLAVTMSGSDRITYSSTGDASSDVAWKEDTNDDSTMKWLDIGDCDSGDIVDIVPLATDMMVFKSNGKVYQFVGDADFNSWAVYNIANFADVTINFKAGAVATNIGDEVVFLSLRGLKSLTTTQDYGNISTTDIGSKFNKLITDDMYEPELHNFRRHRMILIRPGEDKSYWIAFNYGMNAATTLKFHTGITAVLETKDDIFFAGGVTLYLWDDTATTDEGTEIEYIVRPRAVLSNDEMLIKAIDTKFTSDHAGYATLTDGGRLTVSVPTNSRKKIRCNHSTDFIDLTITSTSRFELDHIMLDIAEL